MSTASLDALVDQLGTVGLGLVGPMVFGTFGTSLCRSHCRRSSQHGVHCASPRYVRLVLCHPPFLGVARPGSCEALNWLYAMNAGVG